MFRFFRTEHFYPIGQLTERSMRQKVFRIIVAKIRDLPFMLRSFAGWPST
ncbi:hypothetical protein ACSYAY_06560 [Leptospirillum ferriphilum]|uniref:Uncharacterized protein n=1 Tax=Leptospirillum ferriphilum TaxID=178606 RepID=A0A094WBZ9_9BACT|nr:MULTISPECIES: hypothetical protein [Leptospirillum]KGA94005.1 hypothetical protein LptCag_0631 [Leptospirillum ferriphilum]